MLALVEKRVSYSTWAHLVPQPRTGEQRPTGSSVPSYNCNCSTPSKPPQLSSSSFKLANNTKFHLQTRECYSEALSHDSSRPQRTMQCPLPGLTNKHHLPCFLQYALYMISSKIEAIFPLT